MRPVRKAVFPVAGMGTRFLPATKAMPKEMLPVVDKPLIQYAVEEAVAAGITDLIFVTGRNKRAIEDHFDSAPELESDLESKGKHELLAMVRGILPAHVNCLYIRQSAPLGLGHAVLSAAPAVGDEPFAVLLADDLIDADTPAMKQLVDIAMAQNASVLGVQDVPREDTRKYGIVATRDGEGDGRTERVTHIVEKPDPDAAPSTLAVVGRYVLEAAIFDHLRSTKMGAGNEIQLTDGIASMMRERAVYAHRYDGTRYDCGNKAGMFQATVALGRKYHGLLPE
ncbi:MULTISPECIES: UTP--glucose-1-phosphate uridylyltransferase GalU [Achromobacter]|jgi:UTP--glucose-1-phosphate uridylyltransferase|uniref:UTP--glucose-1-phosphate uridylyltransferase n=1 Tax=Alcaligenes xylosoxydans xylosoxydans TaxID=85698 RepID=A0A0D6G7B6_ALCXX|nr:MULTISPECIES: UTP--glucose-1-phosphate uridylyltransferase GalU [Achromobacter]AHC45498.1 UTP--glucose-1-phosphate uridylyltransferase [Achromobacter xylosoxidans NBRC 15126 = ATCC 27061]AMH06119.1 UTP--glucose-1-phosphate uridylyltransferase [Achromobacter xylosoxidans]AXA75945.1 UTP--glucose-1-phosphate uridylyltransferase [Achromobacter xylosoxidans]KAA5921852.1 UTP--glucose-1-phosphate uridylyltransferase GalU [Achromobacter xylosoxidans]KOQ28331.1 UTP--glucose-1-phosphate uridylyltrans